MVNVIATAAELGYLRCAGTDPDRDRAGERITRMNSWRLITTGSQGESMAALSRMAANIHRKDHDQSRDDTDYFQLQRLSLAMRKLISNVINELSMQGADVIFQDAHVSGHACQEEIKLLYSLVRPKYAIPVHGEYRHLTAQAGIAAADLGHSGREYIHPDIRLTCWRWMVRKRAE